LFLKVLPFFIALVAVLLDVSVLPLFVIDPMLPVFSFCVVIALAMTLGRARGALVGLFAGLLIDVTVWNPFGMTSVVYVMAGYLAGFIGSNQRRILIAHLLIPALCIAVFEATALAMRYVSNGALLFGDGLQSAFRIVAELVLIQALYLLFYLTMKPKRSTYM